MLVGYVDKAVDELAMLGCGKSDEEINGNIVKNGFSL